MGRVGISLLYLAPDRIAGASTFTFGVLNALLARKEHEYALLVPTFQVEQWRQWLAGRSAELIPCRTHPDRRIHRVLFEQLCLPSLARRHRLDAVYFPHAFAPRWRTPPTVVTVHDLMPLGSDTDFPLYKRLYLRWTYRRLASGAATLTTVSEFSRSDLHDKLRISPRTVAVTPNALDDVFLNTERAGSAAVPSLPNNYLLSVAAALPHKRLELLLAVFERLAVDHQALHLVMAGTFSGAATRLRALQRLAATSAAQARIHFLPRLDRAALPGLYANARALVSSSSFEGFGIPLIEALAMGCPVVASPAPAVAEVLGGFGELAHDMSDHALEEALRKVLDSDVASRTRAQEGRAFVRARYTWAVTARALEDAFAKANPQLSTSPVLYACSSTA